VMRICYWALGKRTRPIGAVTADFVSGFKVSSAAPHFRQVIPTELILKPGDKVNFRVRLFDEQGKSYAKNNRQPGALDQ